jgi:pimeloyl-ACP methyl ester carboxylesterase
MALEHSSHYVPSGDVILHYRLFGKPGKTPILILHGAAYFDSYDWIGVAGALAADREVAAMDLRGFGKSSWSPSKDYSTDARLDDMRAIMADRGWARIVAMVHSMTGRIGIAFAATHPELIEKLVVVDSATGGGGAGGPANDGKPPQIFPTVEAAMKSLGGRPNPPRSSHDRARAEQALRKVEGGYILTRDPDFNSPGPVWPGVRTPRLNGIGIWDGLAQAKCPVRWVSGIRSDRRTPESLARLRSFAHVSVADVDSEHDVAAQAPDALVATVTEFLGN